MKRLAAVAAWFVGVWNWLRMFLPGERIKLLQRSYQNGLEMGAFSCASW
jgi:hypothetical protein